MTRIFQTKVEAGQRMVATDITDLTFFPAGAILMMDGSWQDGRGGWYICDGRSTPYGHTPDLRDKFIKGQGSKVATGDGQMTLETKHLPAHKHSITDPGHAHTTKGNSRVQVGNDNGVSYGQNWGDNDCGNTSENVTGITETNNSAGGGQAFDVLPSYYSVIYIKKMV
jgi:microcystin-dependent protein